MASVQELLAAAQTKKSPFIGFLEGAAQGFGQAQSGALERTRQLIELDNMRRQQEEQMAMQAEVQKQIAQQQEADIVASQKAIGTGPRPALPAMKLEQEITQDEKGRYSRRFKTVQTPKPEADKTASSLESILAGRVERGEISLEDALKLKSQGAPGNTQFVGMQGGKPVIFNPKTRAFEAVELPGAGPLVSTTQTEGQANASLYAERIKKANDQIKNLEGKIDLTGTQAGIESKLPNAAQSAQIQQFEQAKRNFLTAVLRRESGAVISPSEMAEGGKQYFPAFGDKPEVIEQKRVNRATALTGLQKAAGGVLTEQINAVDGAIAAKRGQTKIGRFIVEVEQ